MKERSQHWIGCNVVKGWGFPGEANQQIERDRGINHARNDSISQLSPPIFHSISCFVFWLFINISGRLNSQSSQSLLTNVLAVAGAITLLDNHIPVISVLTIETQKKLYRKKSKPTIRILRHLSVGFSCDCSAASASISWFSLTNSASFKHYIIKLDFLLLFFVFLSNWPFFWWDLWAFLCIASTLAYWYCFINRQEINLFVRSWSGLSESNLRNEELIWLSFQNP
jgi:hypothetical protein